MKLFHCGWLIGFAVASFAPGPAPASSEQGSRLRDANVRESGAASSGAGVASASRVTSPKGAPVPPSGGARAEYPDKPLRLIVPFPEAGAPGLVSRRPVRGEGAQAAGFYPVALATPEPFPTRPMRLIVPFPPGGATDPLARMLSQKLAAVFGQQVVVDNRPGAGTTIGAELAAKSPPDGYTLFLGSIANAISAVLYSKLNYDLVRDIAPVTLLATTPGVLVVHPTLPVKSVRELIALAKAQGQLAYASAGNGTPPHLAAELFSYMTGVKMIHVPYKGGGPAVIALLSGEVPLSFASLPSALPHVRAGKLHALGVTTAQRSPALPDVPAIGEAGVPDYAAETWYGLSVTAGTPQEIIARLHAETVKAFMLADVKERLDNMGYLLRLSTSEEYAAFTRSEIEKWRKVVKAANMRAD